ncbi:MAG: peptidoglycan DD-metalloendopeptidase family protein [Candidatus Solibacter usitatus]|nr:peptidoglycan DD-metalloendopeptidase family protein [Candidatus Solibacter usitatus]
MVCLTAPAAVVEQSQTGLAASETACAITRPAARVESSAEQVFLRFVVRGVKAGDRLRIEWVDPQGRVAQPVAYDDLPAAQALCFLSALPVGGFEAGANPGPWRARILLNGEVTHERPFEIVGAAAGLSVKVASVSQDELAIDAHGAGSETSINLARYSKTGGWTYIAHLLPERQEGNRIIVKPPPLEPAEYLVILRNPDGTQSAPARFVVSSAAGYQMPAAAGERWRVSQGPYGSYSHWGRARHAYDIAPVDGRHVTAMRPGTVSAFDLGLGQTPARRIFGNYITLKHEDGEFSHYAHLRAGSFRVRTGDRVDAGQILAEVGNSGYSFGKHVHVHVTKGFSISAQSVPFVFDQSGTALSQNRQSRPDPRWTGEAAFAGWWTRLLDIPRGTSALDVRLGWESRDSDFDLYLVSPSGRTFREDTESVHIDGPEPGQWRVSVQAVRSNPGGQSFWVVPQLRSAGQ